MKIKILTVLVILAVVFAAVSHIGTVGASAKVPEITKKSFVGQTTDLSPAFVFNTPAGHASDYRVSVYGNQTGGSGVVTINYDDDFRHNQFETGISTFVQNAQSTKSIFIIHTASGTPITFATVNTQNPFNDPNPATYNLYITIEEL